MGYRVNRDQGYHRVEIESVRKKAPTHLRLTQRVSSHLKQSPVEQVGENHVGIKLVCKNGRKGRGGWDGVIDGGGVCRWDATLAAQPSSKRLERTEIEKEHGGDERHSLDVANVGTEAHISLCEGERSGKRGREKGGGG